MQICILHERLSKYLSGNDINIPVEHSITSIQVYWNMSRNLSIPGQE